MHLLKSLHIWLGATVQPSLNKSKPGCPFDVQPIAVGEALRRLVGKCLCASVKVKAQLFFKPFQYGVACPFGAEKIVHGLRNCIEQHLVGG